MTTKDNKEEQETVSPSEVGNIIIEARKKKRQKIQTVSKNLKIRVVYLEAIENGDFEELPTGPYAAGFVKTYAEYLGLNSEEIVGKFKEEQKEQISPKKALDMPIPESDEIQPNSNYVIIGVVLVIFIYAIWSSFSSNTDEDVIITEPETTIEETVADEATDEAAIIDEDGEEVIVEEVDEEVSETKLETKEEKFTEVANKKEEAMETTEKLTPAPVAEVVEVETENKETIKVEIMDEATKEVEEVEETPKEDQEEEVKVEEKPHIPQEFGIKYKDDSEMTIKATTTSWVEVKNADEVFLTRIMKEGDVFYAPNKDDLVVSTGNAGALIISIDGDEMAAIGPSGAVRKEYPLNEDNLFKKDH